MARGLAVSDVVNVTTTISPLAAGTRNFGAALHIGVTDVIDTYERIRSYSSLEDVGGDFGTTDPEYLSAERHFGQSPQPSLLYIGRWAQGATSGRLSGGVLSASQQLIAAWTSITNGSFKISIDGSVQTLTTLSFAACANLSAVAAVIDTALSGASVTWDSNSGRFIVKSASTGTASTVSYATAHTSGTDLTVLLKLTSETASAPVDGIAAETLAAAVAAFADKSGDWYAAIVLPSVTNSVFTAAADIVEGLGKKRIIGTTITSTTVLDGTTTTDLASVCKAAGYTRSWSQYSADPHAVGSFFGRAATVDFEGDSTAITLKFKVEPGVTAETITESQASALKGKNCNVFVNYDNDTAIVQEGVMASGMFFDERQGLDWFENRVQTDLWNVLYTSATKIPQTDAGVTILLATVEKACQQAVRNGLAAPGVWNAAGFGKLKQGDYLTSGYYVYAPSVDSQSQSDREARKSPRIQVALKLAGAIHYVFVFNYVNR